MACLTCVDCIASHAAELIETRLVPREARGAITVINGFALCAEHYIKFMDAEIETRARLALIERIESGEIPIEVTHEKEGTNAGSNSETGNNDGSEAVESLGESGDSQDDQGGVRPSGSST